ncbi:unnamed protein product [Camellia sinensis]
MGEPTAIVDKNKSEPIFNRNGGDSINFGRYAFLMLLLVYFFMDSEEAEYAAFEEKVRRNVYIDNLSPQVTEAVLRTALNQFGNVEKVQFIPNHTEPRSIPRCALVEMENSKQAKQIVSEIGNFPFMMSGMPRPIRARAAEMEMFDDHPRKPGRKIKFRWLDPQDPDFKVAKELKLLTRKHAVESSFVLKESDMCNKIANFNIQFKWKDQIETRLKGIGTKLFKQYRVKSNLDQKCNLPNLKGLAPWSRLGSERPLQVDGRIGPSDLSVQWAGYRVIKRKRSVQLAQEEKLANQQAETLKANYEKHELIEGVLNDGSANRLACHYNMKSL